LSKRGLGWQLGIAFALVAVFTALVAGVMLSVFWQRQFDSYVRQRAADNAEGFSLTYAHFYAAYGGWPSPVFIPSPGNSDGLRVQIFDSRGTKLADNADALQQLNRAALLDSPPADAIVAGAPITVAGRDVGAVKVWAESPTGLLTSRDVAFRTASTTALLLAAVIAIALASAAGVVYARGIVKPINRVTATAAALRGGTSDARTGMSGDDPVGALGRTLDQMADSIAADREVERRLTADVAHELRTPLMAIQATVEAMQDGVLPADGERLQTVRDEAVRLARLTDSLLELSRLERRAVPLASEPIDPAAPLTAALGTHRALLESAQLTLNERIDTGSLVIGDADRLQQAFGNLISNAARYTPAGGSVDVDLHVDGANAVVTVSDTGIGIAQEDTERVFTRFWRADEARSRATGGLGVGLAVVKEIVERHSGTISVTSTPGEGAAFAVRLPLATAARPPRSGFRRG
jgi:two-component system, OmpR family, sensor histidine kinase BaeS